MEKFEDFMKARHLRLNEQQQAAVRRVEGPTLLLAVPGSGKTTVIICRLGYMTLELGIDPDSILTLTFSRAGARDLARRYGQVFGRDASWRPSFATIHSFALSVIRQYERQFGRRAFEVLEDAGGLLREIYHDQNGTTPSDNDISDLQSAITLCRNRMFDDAAIDAMKVGDMDFPRIFRAYEAAKRAARLMDFDDMLKYAWLLLRQHPELEREFTSQYRYIHVDEAQDTSTVQFALIHLLAKKSHNLFMVGDEDQSIYGFRGACPGELLHFKKTYPDGQVLLMETNHRSTARLVAASDAFIKLNKERYEKHMTATGKAGVPPVHQHVKTVEGQYRFLLEAIRREGKEIAILYRNNESAIPLVDLFEREGVRYRLKEHNPLFFSHFVVRDVVDFLNFAGDPKDIEIFERIYYKMNCGISRQNLAYVKASKLDKPALDILRTMPSAPDWLVERVQRAGKNFGKLRTMRPGGIIDFILDDCGYRKHLEYRIDSGYREENILEKLSILRILARRAQSREDFLERLKALEGMLRDREDGGKAQVTLSTIHSSKGLEFDKVYLVDAVEGEFPAKSALEDTEEGHRLFNEEVRLFYVGATRARKELEFITVDGDGRPEPSRFITAYMGEKPKREKKTKRIPTPTIGQLGAAYQKKKKSRPAADISAYQVGSEVVHKRFGRGIIAEKTGPLATICFEKSGKKKLDLAVCAGKGVLSPENVNNEKI